MGNSINALVVFFFPHCCRCTLLASLSQLTQFIDFSINNCNRRSPRDFGSKCCALYGSLIPSSWRAIGTRRSIFHDNFNDVEARTFFDRCAKKSGGMGSRPGRLFLIFSPITIATCNYKSLIKTFRLLGSLNTRTQSFK